MKVLCIFIKAFASLLESAPTPVNKSGAKSLKKSQSVKTDKGSDDSENENSSNGEYKYFNSHLF